MNKRWYRFNRSEPNLDPYCELMGDDNMEIVKNFNLDIEPVYVLTEPEMKKFTRATPFSLLSQDLREAIERSAKTLRSFAKTQEDTEAAEVLEKFMGIKNEQR